MTKVFQPRFHGIKSNTGEIITEAPKIAERWRQYCEELYDDEEENTTKWEHVPEPPPLKSEVARAIGQTASRKATGPDDVPVELFQKGGETTVERMHRICMAIWENGEWPDEWTQSIFIPLPKKGDKKQCTNYRTIALVSHASKVLLKIILERIRNKTEEEIADEQAGFRKGRGTRDQIANLRIIMQKTREHQQSLFMCFIDFKKAFDSILHHSLWITMMDMGYPMHLINLIRRLYEKQLAKVRAAGTQSQWFHVRKGVRQGCVLSPYLFNIVAEMVMRETLDGYGGGIQIGGRKISNLRYADDIVLLAGSELELQGLVDRLDRVSQRYGLMINIDKTKTMGMDGVACCIKIGGKQVEQVDAFFYLGSLITEDAECAREIRTRLGRGREVMGTLKTIWKSHGIPITTKLRIWRTLVWPVAMYGCEGWTIKRSDEERINGFEMKGLRQIMRVSWMAKKTNEWVLEQLGTERQMLNDIKTRKLKYFGHVMRKKGECLEKEIMQGTTYGARARGRPRMTWIENIKKWTGLNMSQLMRTAEERNIWRQKVHGAAKLRNKDG